MVRFKPGQRDQVGAGHIQACVLSALYVRGVAEAVPPASTTCLPRCLQVRRALEAAGYPVWVDISRGHAFAVELPDGGGGGGVGGTMQGAAFSPIPTRAQQMLDPGESPGTNASRDAGASPGSSGNQLGSRSREPSFRAPKAHATTLSLAAAAAVTQLSTIPGVVKVQPDKRLHLLQTQGLQPQGVFEPQGVCSSLYPDKSASNGSSVEYVPWGLEAVQALDPAVLEASRSVASKVRRKPRGSSVWQFGCSMRT